MPTVDVRQHDQPLVLISGGIGLTPLLSMLNSIVAAESPRETWLLYGVRDDREHIMRAHLESIARAHPNVHLHVFYSRPAREIDGGGYPHRTDRSRAPCSGLIPPEDI